MAVFSVSGMTCLVISVNKQPNVRQHGKTHQVQTPQGLTDSNKCSLSSQSASIFSFATEDADAFPMTFSCFFHDLHFTCQVLNLLRVHRLSCLFLWYCTVSCRSAAFPFDTLQSRMARSIPTACLATSICKQSADVWELNHLFSMPHVASPLPCRTSHQTFWCP